MTIEVYRDHNVRVTAQVLLSGKKEYRIESTGAKRLYIPYPRIQTAYPDALVRRIIEVKGPVSFADEISREENPAYVAANIDWGVFSYVERNMLDGMRFLDFGCGSGASTCVLARLLPNSEIVGVELSSDFISLSVARAAALGLDNVKFVHSPDGSQLPSDLGTFDYVNLSAVYEHLLPSERPEIIPGLWSSLKNDGVLFIYETPYRWFPIERHTTGLPLLNYLPAIVAEPLARRTPFRNMEDRDWKTLLRSGIRGGSISELKTLLPDCELMEPIRPGVKDRVDLWLMRSRRTGLRQFVKPAISAAAKTLKAVTGVEMVPDLILALKKTKRASRLD